MAPLDQQLTCYVLCQGPVHPALGAHAADVLFAYVYTLRRHNGEQVFVIHPMGTGLIMYHMDIT